MTQVKRIKVPVVVGVGDAQVLVVTEIPLTPPAFAINDEHKEVKITQCKPIKDKVIINGILRKNINFKTLELKDCFDDNLRFCGDVRHCTVEIPFHLFIEVKGSQEGDKCQVEEAEVIGQKREELDKDCDHLTFKKILEKDVIRVEVKVLREEQLDIPVVKPPDKDHCDH